MNENRTVLGDRLYAITRRMFGKYFIEVRVGDLDAEGYIRMIHLDAVSIKALVEYAIDNGLIELKASVDIR